MGSKMLVVDGVKYELWISSTEDEFEQVVKEHAQDIFGEQSIYLDLKQKLKSVSGIGSIPDGFVIILGDSPHWHIVEVELSSHPLHEHIVSQVSRFITGINNWSTQREIARAIYEEITRDGFLKLKVEQVIGSTEIYKFLSDLISKPPILTIIIEKNTEGLRDAISTLAHPEIKVVEFQTFIREGVGLAVHAHLFEALYKPNLPPTEIMPTIKREGKITGTRQGGRITVKNLVDANLVKVGQKIYGSHLGKRYEGTILPEGRVKLLHNYSEWDSLSAAGKEILGYEVDGWTWWRATREDGRECKLDELRKEFESNLSP